MDIWLNFVLQIVKLKHFHHSDYLMGEKIHPKADFFKRIKGDLGINDANVHVHVFKNKICSRLYVSFCVMRPSLAFYLMILWSFCVFFPFFSANLSTFTDSHLRRSKHILMYLKCVWWVYEYACLPKLWSFFFSLQKLICSPLGTGHTYITLSITHSSRFI